MWAQIAVVTSQVKPIYWAAARYHSLLLQVKNNWSNSFSGSTSVGLAAMHIHCLLLCQGPTVLERVDLQTVGLERDDLKEMIKTHGQLSEHTELTYQNIIGALLNLFLDQSPDGKPLYVYKNQAAIVDTVIARHKDVPGLSKRTLDEKFAAANRSLKKSL